ncbi:endoribonuclease XendoU [Ancylostoma caninum]|uniref:Endoribonuclease XendoU n=1 Tax=Ancylostoma caninum TaxID=29170 RepID=A0A368H9U9_ANCCA|nr:endoribonuclease XendoU [Ancylostoma caninum]
MAMMDNFHRKTGKAEPRVSPEEEQKEVSDFLTMALASKPWQVLYDFLEQKGHPYAEDPSTFRAKIKQLWFEHYSRSKGKPDSSGFEHVFIGEEKKRMVSGLHNWIRLYFLEKNADEEFDYKGYIDQRGKVMAALRFTWHGALKKIGSILIGTSPEFDMALYTLCFLSRRGREPCKV